MATPAFDGLARLTAHGFDSGLRIFEPGGPRFRGVGCESSISRLPRIVIIPDVGNGPTRRTLNLPNCRKFFENSIWLARGPRVSAVARRAIGGRTLKPGDACPRQHLPVRGISSRLAAILFRRDGRGKLFYRPRSPSGLPMPWPFLLFRNRILVWSPKCTDPSMVPRRLHPFSMARQTFRTRRYRAPIGESRRITNSSSSDS